MIWDRFDDAHDMVRDEIFAEQHRIEHLEKSLRDKGTPFAPCVPAMPENQPGPQGWFDDTCRERDALRAHRRYLEGLLA